MNRFHTIRATLILALAAAMLFASSCAGTPAPKREAGKSYSLTVLHTNDHHGAILPKDGLAGLAERATYINGMRAKTENMLLIDAGDINTGTALSNMFKGEVDIKAYNMMKYDAVAFGNHEFDGDLALVEKQIEMAEFPFLSANITRKNGKYLDQAYIVKDFEGFRVGIFGLTTLRTLVIASPDKSLTFADEIETAKAIVTQLRTKEKCDIVILSSHMGLTEEVIGQTTSDKLAAAVPGIDLIIDGHSHTQMGEALMVGTTPIVSANEWGKFVGEAHFEIVDGKVASFVWQPIAINTKDAKTFAPDAAVAAMIAPYKEKADLTLKEVVAETSAEFVFGDRLSRKKEIALGNMVNDGAMWYMKEVLNQKVDFAFTNGGNIRTSLPAGKVTREDITTVLPFDNILYLTTMNGKQIVELFEFIASIPQGAGAWAQMSKEARYTIDYSAGLKNGVLKDLTIHGQKVDPTKDYTFVVPDYLMTGGDGYAVLANNIGSFNTSTTLRDVVIEYAAAVKLLTPATDGRITIINGMSLD